MEVYDYQIVIFPIGNDPKKHNNKNAINDHQKQGPKIGNRGLIYIMIKVIHSAKKSSNNNLDKLVPPKKIQDIKNSSLPVQY
jgi:hypothetical protein